MEISSNRPGISKPGSKLQPTWTRILLLSVLGYEGLGGLAGGGMLIAKPDGQLMDMPVEMMHGVFTDFFIPGLILMGMSILSMIAFYFVIRRKKTDWLWASVTLAGWIIWFVTEIIIIQELHWLHIMWAVPVLWGVVAAIPLIMHRNDTKRMKNILLFCGVLSSVWYVAINIYVPMQYDGYSIPAYTPSELSAVGAPTRILWVLLVLPYTLLFAAFGWGVLSIASNRFLRVMGSLIIAYSLFNTYWPPMHMRGTETTVNDTLHLVWAAITVLLMIVMMGFGAASQVKSFRIYTVISIMLHIVFGILTSMEAPNIPINGPTPTIGIWERINIGIFMLWVIVFAVVLLKKNKKSLQLQT